MSFKDVGASVHFAKLFPFSDLWGIPSPSYWSAPASFLCELWKFSEPKVRMATCFEVATSPGIGRYLVATRDIKPLELVFDPVMDNRVWWYWQGDVRPPCCRGSQIQHRTMLSHLSQVHFLLLADTLIWVREAKTHQIGWIYWLFPSGGCSTQPENSKDLSICSSFHPRPVTGEFCCPSCNFPMCGQECAADPKHAHLECSVFPRCDHW